MVEVYNESVYDLLAMPEDGHQKLTIQKQGKDVVVPVSVIPYYYYYLWVQYLAILLLLCILYLSNEKAFESVYQ